MGAADLVQVLHGLPQTPSPNLLIGSGGGDDGAAYLLPDGKVMVQTLDFFTPIVDDPYTFGQIAAANAISDIYAMGATPVMALNIVAFPLAALGHAVLREVLRGGADKAAEASIPIAGGHSIDDAEPKYGMVVTGLCDAPEQLLSNAEAKPGDVIVLTKPIGVGIVTTGIKRDLVSEQDAQASIQSMAALNRSGGEAARAVGARCATDITGFGLLGHIGNIARESKVRITLNFADLPLVEHAQRLVQAGCAPGGTRKNLLYYGNTIDWRGEWQEWQKLLMADAQTSGGMAICVPEAKADALINELRERNALCAAVIGRVESGEPGISAVVV